VQTGILANLVTTTILQPSEERYSTRGLFKSSV
jgi:hypothetical protein